MGQTATSAAIAHSTNLAEILFAVLLLLVAVPVSVIDIRQRRIPNLITGPTAATALAIGIGLDLSGQPERLLGAGLAAALLLLPTLVSPGGIGMGDVKLAAVIGLCLGFSVFLALLIATLGTCAFGLWVAFTRGLAQARKLTVAFGPFLMAGALIAAGAELSI